MTEANQKYFSLLKKTIAKTFLEHHSAPKNMVDWKGETITLFQVDLLNKTKGSISEKSFYTYFKKETEKLPRIDVLNILCKYAGYTNWDTFKNEQGEVEIAAVSEAKKKKHLVLPFIGVLVVLIVASSFFFFEKENNYTFCLVDEDEQTPLKNKVRIEILKANESSVFVQTNAQGCFSHKTASEQICFVVQSPYYKTDTIIRSRVENKNTLIPLRKDDYALMLKFYSDGNLKDVKKRRKQLDNLIAPKAQIYQVFQYVTGIELYTKQEFINKMTIPTSALKGMHILDKEYTGGKITKLKFIVR